MRLLRWAAAQNDRPWVRNLAVAAFFAAVVGSKLAPVWAEGPSRVVPIPAVSTRAEMPERFRATANADVTFYTWLTARNARTLATRPHRLFDTEHCAPSEQTLTLSAPGIALGLMGIPALFVTGDPFLTYNSVVAAALLLAAFAMYGLVRDWTGSTVAGVVAGLLFGLHPVRIDQIFWIAELDTTWTVLALLLARRLFERWRWVDAVLLAAVCSLQIATSFYSLLSASLLGAAFLVWLVRANGVRRIEWTRLLFVGAVVVVAAFLVLGPYLEVRSSGVLFDRDYRTPMPLSAYLPGRHFFLGTLLLALASTACFAGRRGLDPGRSGDPRWALLAAIGALVLVAADWTLDLQARAIWPGLPVPLPNFYELVAHAVPGMRNIRVVHLLTSGVLLAATVLAGIGAASLIRRSGRWQPLVAAGLVAAAVVTVAGARPFGDGKSGRVVGVDIRPDAETVAFFEELGRRGGGAILELPFNGNFEPYRVLRSYYHRRRTSGCYSSYSPKEREALTATVRLPFGGEAVRAVRRLGFTTIVVHGRAPKGAPYRRSLERLAGGPNALVERSLQGPGLAAYEIAPEAPSGR